MKNYILHCINRCDNGLPFDECGLVWTAHSNILPSIPGSCCQENFNKEFSPQVETAPKGVINLNRGKPDKVIKEYLDFTLYKSS